MIRSARKPPVNVNEADQHLFGHEYKKIFTEPQVLEISNVLTDGELSIRSPEKYPAAIAEKTASLNVTLRSFVKKIVSFKFKREARPVVMITDGWSGGYFHWLLDCLPRLMLLKGTHEKAKIALPHSLEKYSFVRESLELLNIREYFFLRTDSYYHFSKIIFPAHLAPTGNYNDTVLQKLRLRLTAPFDQGRDHAGSKIYISRRHAGRRTVSNEEQINELLTGYGYKTIFCEDLDFAEQVALFSNVHSLVANHGAGLSNMLFMPQGSRVVELRFEDDAQNNCYFSLASAMEIKYFYLSCRPSSPDKDPHTANIFVEPAELKALLNKYNL